MHNDSTYGPKRRVGDDIIVILGGDIASKREFVSEFMRHSRFFKLKVESISAVSALINRHERHCVHPRRRLCLAVPGP